MKVIVHNRWFDARLLYTEIITNLLPVLAQVPMWLQTSDVSLYAVNRYVSHSRRRQMSSCKTCMNLGCMYVQGNMMFTCLHNSMSASFPDLFFGGYANSLFIAWLPNEARSPENEAINPLPTIRNS